MEGELQENVRYDFDNDVHPEMHVEKVVCPNCQKKIPKGDYCPHCGYPQLEKSVSVKKDMRGEFNNDLNTNSIDADKNEEQMVETESKDSSFRPTIPISSIEKQHSDESSGDYKEDEKFGFFSSMRKFMGFKMDSHSRADGIHDNEIQESPKVEKDTQVEKETEFPLVEVPKEELFEIVEEINEDSEEVGDFKVEEMNINILESGIVENEVKESEYHTSLYEPDPKLVEIQKGFLQSIFMKLWLINHLQERGIEEQQFNKMFDNYEALYSCFSSRREKILSQSKDVSSLETSLGKAKVYFEELKMKKSIGKVSEEEYEVKTKALEWDINNYEEEISRKNKDIEFLMDLPRTTPMEEVTKLKAMAERCKWAMDNFESSNKISSECAKKVRESLHDTLDLLEDFQNL